MPKKRDDGPLGNAALGDAFISYVNAAFLRNPQRSWTAEEGYDAEALEQAEDEAANRLQELLKARKSL